MESYWVDDLIEELRSPSSPGVRAGLSRAWTDGSRVAWLETRNFHFGQPDDALLARIRELGKRLGDKAELGLFALLQTLEPDRPLVLLPGVELDAPAHLEALLAAHPKPTASAAMPPPSKRTPSASSNCPTSRRPTSPSSA